MRIEVSDEGPGLPAGIVALAERREGATRHGHGLAVAASVARRHGGRLAPAPSARGARIGLELPRARDRAVTRRRRALLLAGLALLLGGLAASDVASRESALREGLGPSVGVVVARSELAAGSTIRRESLSVREVPARYAPRGAVADPGRSSGCGCPLTSPPGRSCCPRSSARRAGAPRPVRRVAKGERVAEVVAAAAAGQVVPGGRVDVLVTRDDRPGAPGRTVLALEDVAVVAVASAPAGETAGTARVAASLRVTLRQAVYLAAAQAFAQELRLLPRAPGDRARGRAGMSADASLELG